MSFLAEVAKAIEEKPGILNYLTPSAQELAGLARSRLRQCHNDIPVVSRTFRLHHSTSSSGFREWWSLFSECRGR